MEGVFEVPKLGVLPYAYHMLPFLFKDNEILASELVRNYGSNKEEVLFRRKGFTVAIPLIPALIYGLISGTVGVAVGAGVSEAVRSLEHQDTPVVEQSKDYDNHDYTNYNTESV